MKITRLSILKDLFLEYQKTPCLDTFESILKRVDNFILYMVKDLKRSRYYLKTVDTGELYQIGILGVYDAINTFKPEDSSSVIPARMKICIRKVIVKSYSCYKKEIVTSDPFGLDYVNILGLGCIQSGNNIYEKEDLNLIVKHINKLLVVGNLSESDIILLRERIVLGKSLRIVAKKLGVSSQTISSRAMKIRSKIVLSIVKGVT